jgi:hypothetical protein
VCLHVLQSYILANAAVSRSFSAYFAALIGKPTTFFTFPYKDYTVDFLAAGLMVACGLLLMFTTAGVVVTIWCTLSQCRSEHSVHN